MAIFSFTLIQKIEAHAEAIAGRIAGEIRRDPRLPNTRRLTSDELSRRIWDLLENLGGLLVARDPEVARWAEPLGRTRFEQSIPLHELIRCLLIVEARLIDFARAGMLGSAVQIYAAEEIQYRLSRFFDEVIYYAARGYELARSNSIPVAGLAARAAGAGAGSPAGNSLDIGYIDMDSWQEDHMGGSQEVPGFRAGQSR